MWPNRYWANYWADRYWPPEGEDAVVVIVAPGESRTLVIGIGPMGKPSAHPHPIFSRHKL